MTDFESFYNAHEAIYIQTANSAKNLIKSLLATENIEYLSVDSRIKTLSSCLEKIERKKYTDPSSKITDIVGLRVIVYFENQISVVEQIIRENLYIDESNSSSKQSELGSDKIGYRSTHIICSIDASRKTLREYKNISEQKFEIQIRTVLQHAWAELAHDRAYKLATGLPKHIQREVNLYSGLLEIVDSALSRISKEIDAYKDQVGKEDESNQSINNITLVNLLRDICETYKLDVHGNFDSNVVIISELENFGFEDIKSIRNSITPDFIEAEKKYEKSDTVIGLLRNLMIWSDPEKYFSRSWNHNWQGISSSTIDMMHQKHANFGEIVSKYSVEIHED